MILNFEIVDHHPFTHICYINLDEDYVKFFKGITNLKTMPSDIQLYVSTLFEYHYSKVNKSTWFENTDIDKLINIELVNDRLDSGVKFNEKELSLIELLNKFMIRLVDKLVTEKILSDKISIARLHYANKTTLRLYLCK